MSTSIEDISIGVPKSRMTNGLSGPPLEIPYEEAHS